MILAYMIVGSGHWKPLPAGAQTDDDSPVAASSSPKKVELTGEASQRDVTKKFVRFVSSGDSPCERSSNAVAALPESVVIRPIKSLPVGLPALRAVNTN